MGRPIDYRQIAPTIAESVRSIEPDDHELDESLVEFVKLRASQLNGCAYCTDLHSRKLHRAGENARKIAAVATWQESPFFSTEERAALLLTDALTMLSGEPIPDDVYKSVQEAFDEETRVDLVAVIVTINCWNRLWVMFGTPKIPPLDGRDGV